MTRFAFELGCVLGVAACATLFVPMKRYVSQCIIGTPAQEAEDVANYRPAVLAALAQAHERDGILADPNVSYDQLAAATSHAWGYLQQCAAEHGLDMCQAVGTEPNMQLRAPGDGGPAFEDADDYIHQVSTRLPGPRFSLLYWPSGPNEWQKITITFPDELGLEVFVVPAMYRCADAKSAVAVRQVGVRQVSINKVDVDIDE